MEAQRSSKGKGVWKAKGVSKVNQFGRRMALRDGFTEVSIGIIANTISPASMCFHISTKVLKQTKGSSS